MNEERRVGEYFTREAQRFDRIYAGRQSSAVQHFVDLAFRRRELTQRLDACRLAVVGARRILEIGCGSGRLAVALAESGAANVTGIDLSSNMIQLSQTLAEQAGVGPRCHFLCSSPEMLQTDQTYDAVVAIGVSDYTGDIVRLLSRMRELSHGRIVVSFPRSWMLLNPIRRLWLASKNCPVHFYELRAIEEVFRRCRLRVVALSRIGRPPVTGSFVVTGAIEDQ